MIFDITQFCKLKLLRKQLGKYKLNLDTLK